MKKLITEIKIKKGTMQKKETLFVYLPFEVKDSFKETFKGEAAWVAQIKCWTIPNSEENISKVKTWRSQVIENSAKEFSEAIAKRKFLSNIIDLDEVLEAREIILNNTSSRLDFDSAQSAITRAEVILKEKNLVSYALNSFAAVKRSNFHEREDLAEEDIYDLEKIED